MTRRERKDMARPAARYPIPDQLRAIIRARGLTAYELARAIDTAPSVISRFLAGERGLTLDTFDRLAEALHLRLIETSRPSPRSTGRGRTRADRTDRALDAPGGPDPCRPATAP